VRGTLQIAVDAPTCMDTDTRAVLLPATWAGQLAGVTAVTGRGDVDALDMHCDVSLPALTWVRFPARTLAKRPPGEARIGTEAAQLTAYSPTEGDVKVARVEIALAAELSVIPRDLHTVLVVDESRSVEEAERAAQQALVAAYLRAAPRTKVQIVGYARDAKPLLPGWSVASEVTGRIERTLAGRVPRNGSSIVQARPVASAVLARVGGTGPFLLATDDRLSDGTAHALEGLASGLPARTLVHVIALDSDSALAPLASATEGIVFPLDPGASERIDALSLVRPVALDGLELTGAGWDPLSITHGCADRVMEGQSCEWIATGGSGPVTVTGRLWGHEITRVLTPDVRRPTALARVLQATATNLPGATYDAVQYAAKSVNAMWSLVATWGTGGGYADLVVGGLGTIGTGSFSTSSHDSIGATGTARVSPDLRPELIAQLGPVVRGCQATGKVTVDVELTREEIAGVAVALTASNPDLETCITEGIWAANIALRTPPAHATVRLVL